MTQTKQIWDNLANLLKRQTEIDIMIYYSDPKIYLCGTHFSR